MRLAIWSVTRNGGALAREIAEELPSIYDVDVYTLKKFDIEKTIAIDNFTEELEKRFIEYNGHIFIMATGIVVRKIAKLIKSKDVDPSVLVVDEKKTFVISLLSGHLGGANELAQDIGEYCGIVPIITTSSDINGKIAVDIMAMKLKSRLEDLEQAKKVTALIVDGKSVELKIPKNINDENPQGIIVLSNKKNIELVQIYPQNLIVGIGCKRGTSRDTIIEAMEEVFNKHNLTTKSIKIFASVDVKSDEIGLLQMADFYKKDIEFIGREEIKKVEDMFEGSDFVRKTIGVSCVSEPCAYILSDKKGRFIEKKFIYNGVTVSIYENCTGYKEEE